MQRSRSRTAALLFAGAGVVSGVALGLARYAAPAALAAAEEGARAAARALLASTAATSAADREWTSMLRRLPPDMQTAIATRRAAQRAVEQARRGGGRPPCRHVRCRGDAGRLTWCAAREGLLPACSPTCGISETVAGLAAALEGKLPPPPSPRRGTVPANYSGARPPRAPRAGRAAAAA